MLGKLTSCVESPSDRHTLDPASHTHHTSAEQHHSGSSWPDRPHKPLQATLAAAAATTQRVPAVDSAATAVAEEAPLLQQVLQVLGSAPAAAVAQRETPLWRGGDQPQPRRFSEEKGALDWITAWVAGALSCESEFRKQKKGSMLRMEVEAPAF